MAGEECQNWNMYYRYNFPEARKATEPKKKKEKENRLYYMVRGKHTHLKAHKEHYTMDGEHNYCRAFVHDYLGVGQVRPPECLKKSAPLVYKNPWRVAKDAVELEPCNVPVCSPCMYGDGRGNLSPYRHKLPIYNGTIRQTFRQYV